MQESTLVPSEHDSDEEVADILEQQYLPKTPSTLSTITERGPHDDTPMKTRAASAKRPANYPIQEPPLTQQLPEGERVVAYASRTLNHAERNYSATELECLAVVWGIRRMRDYLEGYRFTVLTDHQSLRWLQRLEAPSGRLARWLFELQQHDFEIKYRRGSQNQVADALSRQPEVAAARPTPQCKWYHRICREVQARPTDRPLPNPRRLPAPTHPPRPGLPGNGR